MVDDRTRGRKRWLLGWLTLALACSGERSEDFGRPDASLNGATASDGAVVVYDAEAHGAATDAGPDGEVVSSDAGDGAAPERLRLEVRIEGDGSGAVQDGAGSIHCEGGEGSACTASLNAGEQVTLTARPAPGSRFAGWAGVEGCGVGSSCELTIQREHVVTAIFVVHEVTLNVTRVGNGQGSVESDPAGVLCGDDCAQTFAAGSAVRLAARAAESSVFVGFFGACTGDEPHCSLIMSEDLAVSAEFALRRHAVRALTAGPGTGVLRLEKIDGSACGTPCEVDHGTELLATAEPGLGSDFASFDGVCAGQSNPCRFTVVAPSELTAHFALQSFPIAVAKLGTGAGVVTSEPAGISCGSTCMMIAPFGSMVTLRAQADTASSRFAGWSGACGGNVLTCALTVSQASSASAQFELLDRTLTVVSTGGGSVRGVLAGTATQVIQCGADCTESRPHGTQIALSPVFDAARVVFNGWSGGGCSGTGNCTVTLDAARTVNATFSPRRYTLTLVMDASAEHDSAMTTIRSTPAGIQCSAPPYPKTCTMTVNYGTSIRLDASGSLIDIDWTGCTVAAGQPMRCTVVVTGNKTVRTSSYALL